MQIRDSENKRQRRKSDMTKVHKLRPALKPMNTTGNKSYNANMNKGINLERIAIALECIAETLESLDTTATELKEKG